MKTGLWLSRRHVRWTIVLLALLPILPTILMVQMMLENAEHERKLAITELADVHRSQLIAAVGRLESADDPESMPEGLRKIFGAEEVGLRVEKPDGTVVLSVGPEIGEEAIVVRAGPGEYEGWKVMLDPSGTIPDVISELERATLWQAFWIFAGVMAAAGGVWFVVHRGLRVDELRSDMVTTVSHEMKTPVASMKILLETLTESDFLDDQGRAEYLDLLAKENRRLERLAENFLTFSRLKKGEMQLTPGLLDVEAVVSEVCALIRPRFDEVGGKLEQDIQPGLYLRADREALLMVLGNLVENGLKYGGDQPVVKVSARAAGKRLLDGRIEVSDNGPGIGVKDRRTVFRRFFQGDDPLNQKRNGVGLGLSICRRLVRLMRGRIQAEGGKDGTGACFVVVLRKAVVDGQRKSEETGEAVAKPVEKGEPAHV